MEIKLRCLYFSIDERKSLINMKRQPKNRSRPAPELYDPEVGRRFGRNFGFSIIIPKKAKELPE